MYKRIDESRARNVITLIATERWNRNIDKCKTSQASSSQHRFHSRDSETHMRGKEVFHRSSSFSSILSVTRVEKAVKTISRSGEKTEWDGRPTVASTLRVKLAWISILDCASRRLVSIRVDFVLRSFEESRNENGAIRAYSCIRETISRTRANVNSL